MAHLDTEALNAGLDHIRASPPDNGTVEMIVSRPDVGAREVLEGCELRVGEGLVGDNYVARGSRETDDGSAHPEAQLNLMMSRSVDLCADGDRERWPLAGDQLLVDLDLGEANLAIGTRLELGTAIIEVSAKPHNGCAKFSERFGIDAARWVNHDKSLRLRGINAMVVQSGTVKAGDKISKITG